MKRFLLLSVLFAPTLVSALPTADSFKKIPKSREVKVQDCAVTAVSGAVVPVTLTFSLSKKQPEVSLPASFEKASKAVGPKGGDFVACGTSDVDPTKTVVFFKTSKAATTATEVALAVADFKDGGSVGSACGSVRPWSRNFIYKTVGSHHFTDIRRSTVGLIMTHGANVPTPSCIDILASDGTKVGDFGLYARGAGWFARYYGGIGCGDPIGGATLAGRARKAAGSDSIYVKIGSVCYGPIAASRCVGSKAC